MKGRLDDAGHRPSDLDRAAEHADLEQPLPHGTRFRLLKRIAMLGLFSEYAAVKR